MKKLLAVLLALTMLLGLVGCGSKSSSSDSSSKSDGTVELVWWAHHEDQWVNTYKKVIEGFEAENPGIKIKLETFPYDEFESKVLTSLSSQSGGADIYEMWGGWGVDYAPTGALAPLPDTIANEIVNDAYVPTYGSLYHEGKLYGLPLEFNIEYGGLLVNLNMLNEAGLKPATTWDELKTQAKSFTKADDTGALVQKGFDFCNLDSVTYLFTAMILQQGASYRNEDGTFNFTSAEAKKAFEELASLLSTDKVTDFGELVNADIIGYNELYAGLTAYVPRGPWVIPTGTASEADGGFALELGKDFDYIALPTYGSEAKFVAETGWSLAINAKSEKLDAAYKFIDYLFRDDVARTINLGCGTIPAKKSVANSEEYLTQCPYAKPLVQILDKAEYIGAFNTDVFKEIVANHLMDYVSGKYASVDECLKEMETECNAMVGL